MVAVSRLAAGLSRDVGKAIGAAADAVRDALALLPVEEPVHEALTEAAAALQRAGLVARQLDTLAAPPSPRREPRSLGEVVGDLRPLAARLAGASVVVEADALASDAWIAAEPGQVEQVLFHLVVNARDAMADGGRMAIRVSRREVEAPLPHRYGVIPAGGWALLEVSDTGHGMDETVLGRLFEPFFTTKPPGLGSGLGLATVYGIAQQLGGQVSVTSRPMEGTTVTLWVPLAVATPGAAGDVRPGVLVVEDDPWVRSVTARALRRAGHGVLEAADAEAALAMLRGVAGQSVRVVLSDVGMPGMCGDVLVERIAAERDDLRLILMTGRDQPPAPREGQRPVALLRKPFSRHQLLEAVGG